MKTWNENFINDKQSIMEILYFQINNIYIS